MESVTWVEVLSRHREVVARYRFTGSEITVGRAYRNEIVLDDPHVAPAHLRIRRGEAGILIAEDLDSLNGLYLDGGKTRLKQIAIEPGHSIRVGQTYLRIRDADHPVPPELPVRAERRTWPLAILLGAAILGIEIISTWLTETREPRLSSYLLPVLLVSGYCAAWVTLWAVLSRVFAGTARFERHLLIALSAMLLYSVYDELTDIGAFALSWPGLVTNRYMLFWTALGATALLHMRTIGRFHMGLKVAGALAIPIVAITYLTINQADQRTLYDPPQLVRRFYPPGFRLSPLKTEADFFQAVGGMKDRLDRGRDEDKP